MALRFACRSERLRLDASCPLQCFSFHEYDERHPARHDHPSRRRFLRPSPSRCSPHCPLVHHTSAYPYRQSKVQASAQLDCQPSMSSNDRHPLFLPASLVQFSARTHHVVQFSTYLYTTLSPPRHYPAYPINLTSTYSLHLAKLSILHRPHVYSTYLHSSQHQQHYQYVHRMRVRARSAHRPTSSFCWTLDFSFFLLCAFFYFSFLLSVIYVNPSQMMHPHSDVAFANTSTTRALVC